LPVSDEKISFEYKVRRFLEGSLMAPERAHVYWNGTFSDARQARPGERANCPDSLNKILAELRQASSGGDDVAPYLWFDQKYFLPDDILSKVDRMSMAHAVEVRPPFSIIASWSLPPPCRRRSRFEARARNSFSRI
jgi:asparagine synthase (glutamine-hydrolysing)